MTFTTKTQIIGATTDEETGYAVAIIAEFPQYAVMNAQDGSWYSRPTDDKEEAEDIARERNESEFGIRYVAVEIRPVD